MERRQHADLHETQTGSGRERERGARPGPAQRARERASREGGGQRRGAARRGEAAEGSAHQSDRGEQSLGGGWTFLPGGGTQTATLCGNPNFLLPLRGSRPPPPPRVRGLPDPAPLSRARLPRRPSLRCGSSAGCSAAARPGARASSRRVEAKFGRPRPGSPLRPRRPAVPSPAGGAPSPPARPC